MTDQPDWPGWAPPGGEGPDREAAARPTERDRTGAADEDVEPTDQMPVHDQIPVHDAAATHEHTQQLPTDPPPPPPPPAATQQAAWPPPPTGQPAYGAGGWAPPPTKPRTGVVIAIVLGVMVLMVAGVLVLGGVLFSTSTSTSGPEPVPEGELPPSPDLDAPDDREAPSQVPADDLQAQAEAVLDTINVSEERMIAFQETVFAGIGEDGNVGDAAADIAGEAQEAGDDLTQLRSDLRALAGGQQDEFEGLRDIRDTYAAHMDAWIDYVDAVAGSPALAAPNSEEAVPLWREIEVTGDDFVTAVETGLPEDLPSELQELADFIIERGFGGAGDGSTGDVV